MASLNENLYTDLALERHRADTSLSGVEYKKSRGTVGIWERIAIESLEGAASIGRPMGIYDTLILPRVDLLDLDSIDAAKDEMSSELTSIMARMSIIPERILVAGLGNAALTPDSVGCECALRVKPTMHIRSFDPDMFYALQCSEIAVVRPGVGSESGMDAIETVKGVCERIHPDVVIAVDALAARAQDRLGSTVQISSTGIIPGSGLGNSKKALNLKTLGTPVVAVGVPTIMDARLFIDECRREGAPEMFVSPKEINEIVAVAADIIAGGINLAFGLGE